MPTDIVMPQMGESIFEGTITKWLKKPGDKVQRDEPLFEISTDKVDAEIPAPAAGILQDIKVAEGATVQVNTVVGTIAVDGESRRPRNRLPHLRLPRPRPPRPRHQRKIHLQRNPALPQPSPNPRPSCTGAGRRRSRPLVAAGPQDRAREQHQPVASGRHRPRRPHYQAGHYAFLERSETTSGSRIEHDVPPLRSKAGRPASPARRSSARPFLAISCP